MHCIVRFYIKHESGNSNIYLGAIVRMRIKKGNIHYNNEAIVPLSGSHDGQLSHLSMMALHTACIYENNWNKGNILNIDEFDVEVTFIKKCRGF